MLVVLEQSYEHDTEVQYNTNKKLRTHRKHNEVTEQQDNIGYTEGNRATGKNM